MRRLAAILVVVGVCAGLLLAAFGGLARAEHSRKTGLAHPDEAPRAAEAVPPQVAGAVPIPVPLPRPRPPIWLEPHSFREAAGPDFNSAEVTDLASDCRKRLEEIAEIEAMPRLIGPGACGGGDMVQLQAVRLKEGGPVALNPKPLIRCEMAEQLASFIRDDAAPRVAKTGAALARVETYDDFECRGRNRVLGAKLSEHGKGNAVDVRAFVLADNKAVTLTDPTVSKDLREDIRAAACARFTTVLGPGSDSHHESHIHLDLVQRTRGYRICQWDVREPVVAEVVPLPPPRPTIALNQSGPVKDGVR